LIFTVGSGALMGPLMSDATNLSYAMHILLM
jgi:hypothetical protein